MVVSGSHASSAPAVVHTTTVTQTGSVDVITNFVASPAALPPPDPALRFDDVQSGCRAAVVDTPDKLETVLDLHMSGGAVVAVDLEGANLGPTGTLSTVQLCVEGSSDVFVCDVLTMKAAAFATSRSSLRQLLEDPANTKIFWDCRTDAAALYHQFGVRPRGVLDLQLCHVAMDVAVGGCPKYLTGLGKVLGMTHGFLHPGFVHSS